MAFFPNRCQHIKVNGTLCECPALRRNKFCYFHKRHHDERVQLNADRTRRRSATIELPVLEDANSIQVSLMQIMRLLVAGQLDGKTAGLLLYALQTASANLRHTRFEPYMHDVVLDPRTVHETPLSAHIWEDSDFISEEEDEEAMRAQALEEARVKAKKKAELDRWAEGEANRLAEEGRRERAAEEEYDRYLEAQAEAMRKRNQERLEARTEKRTEERTALATNKPTNDVIPTAREARGRDLTSATATDAASGSTAAASTKSTSLNVTVQPYVTPAGHAVIAPKPSAGKRPPAKVNLNDVRRKVHEQIRKALPALAHALKEKENSGRSG